MVKLIEKINASQLTEREIKAFSVLDSFGIEYKAAEHSAAATIDDCREVEKVLGCEICKNLFLCNRQKTLFALLLLPGDKQFKTKDFSAQIGSARLSFADHGDMEKYIDCTPGSASFLGIFNDRENKVILAIDRELLGKEYFACHPCQNTMTVAFKTSDLLNKLIPNCGHIPVTVDLPG